jgi:DNA topoisomerase 2-associated protein PAT1
MSFFGLETAPGSEKPSVYDFEETFDDRLGDQLEETNDDLNDETFGEFSVSKDFDFAGQTAKVADTIDEEQFTFVRTQPAPLQPTKVIPKPPTQDIESIPSLQPIASLWGVESQQPVPQPVPQPAAQPMAQPVAQPMAQPMAQPKVLSLEEVEAEMMARRTVAMAPQMATFPPPQFGAAFPMMGPPPPPPGHPFQDPAIMMSANQYRSDLTQMPRPPQPPQPQIEGQQPLAQVPYSLPTHTQHAPPVPLSQVMNEDLAKNAEDHQRLLEKSRKMAEVVRYNGLMSQWDKNFVMRIQLQQMVTADPYNEDFYYQVHTAIQARTNPHQPLNEFAKTYLIQRGRGGRFRRYDNPLQRMQEQVQQAVASAKEHPKKEQIAPEGALGKISMGTGNRPRRALNVSKADSLKQSLEGASKQKDRYTTRGVLRAIETVYTILLEIEGVERSRPNQPPEAPEMVEWEIKMQALVERAWNEMQVLESVDSENNQPFILMLSHDKAKKVIPRIFRHLDQKQRLTVLTRIVAHIDSLDVVKDGVYDESEVLRAKTRESIELFSQTVLPPLVHLVSESSYDVVIGLLEIMLNSSNMVHVASSKIGLAFLTVLISRAELINQEDKVDPRDLENWHTTFNSIFARVQGHLEGMFPPRNVDNSYVWHFMASLALAAKLEHQRIIVDEVRNRIFGTMAEAKTLPVELAVQKIANLNLFLNVMGLNATTSDISELSA